MNYTKSFVIFHGYDVGEIINEELEVMPRPAFILARASTHLGGLIAGPFEIFKINQRLTRSVNTL